VPSTRLPNCDPEEGKRLAVTSDKFEAWACRGANDTPLPCTVMNMRADSATIFSAEITLPNTFLLLLLSDGSLSRNCKVLSRQDYTAVIEFVT
jgi:hypothetical protein